MNIHTGLALLRRVDALGYRAFLIEEVCGFPFDCRNVLCLPAERQADFANSPVLDALVASRRLFAVTAYVENEAHLAEQSGLAWLIGREWPKPGAALGLDLPLRVSPVEANLAELSAGWVST